MFYKYRTADGLWNRLEKFEKVPMEIRTNKTDEMEI